MKTVFNRLSQRQHRHIRATYFIVIVFLIVYALVTYQQLQALRKRPVLLPNYWFQVTATAASGAAIHAQGSWRSTLATDPPQLLQTTTLECYKNKMFCVESTATVSTSEGSFLDVTPTVYDVDHWTDAGLTTKPTTKGCAINTLTVVVADRSVIFNAALAPGKTECKDAPRSLKLDSGNASRTVAPSREK